MKDEQEKENTVLPYKFREDELIEEFKAYIDMTYGGHYGQGGLQSAEVIVDRGHGMGFFLGNVDKYNARYGKKGNSPQEHRKDIFKILHYALLALYEHDRINEKKQTVSVTAAVEPISFEDEIYVTADGHHR